jgi:crossover junction endodeoxyribonuclease RuvC
VKDLPAGGRPLFERIPTMRVVGIDPGISHTGFGIVDTDARGRLTHIASGSISTSAKTPFVKRLLKIHRELEIVYQEYEPHHMAVEQVFFARNPRSALLLGQARGVALLSAALEGIPVYEYAATEIKKAVCRYGHAGKQQVSEMVKALLRIDKKLPSHASDALAVSICHAHCFQTSQARSAGLSRATGGKEPHV